MVTVVPGQGGRSQSVLPRQQQVGPQRLQLWGRGQALWDWLRSKHLVCAVSASFSFTTPFFFFGPLYFSLLNKNFSSLRLLLDFICLKIPETHRLQSSKAICRTDIRNTPAQPYRLFTYWNILYWLVDSCCAETPEGSCQYSGHPSFSPPPAAFGPPMIQQLKGQFLAQQGLDLFWRGQGRQSQAGYYRLWISCLDVFTLKVKLTAGSPADWERVRAVFEGAW